jgi:hypothetical protein
VDGDLGQVAELAGEKFNMRAGAAINLRWVLTSEQRDLALARHDGHVISLASRGDLILHSCTSQCEGS